jgi:hypothetical protein
MAHLLWKGAHRTTDRYATSSGLSTTRNNAVPVKYGSNVAGDAQFLRVICRVPDFSYPRIVHASF